MNIITNTIVWTKTSRTIFHLLTHTFKKHKRGFTPLSFHNNFDCTVMLDCDVGMPPPWFKHGSILFRLDWITSLCVTEWLKFMLMVVLYFREPETCWDIVRLQVLLICVATLEQRQPLEAYNAIWDTFCSTHYYSIRKIYNEAKRRTSKQ